MLQTIHGIGHVKARDLVENHNINSIDDLKNKKELLNDKQLMGLRYVDDFEKRIPKAEMDKHFDYIKTAINKIDPQIRFEVAGSYRRGAKTSGDIDVLITKDDHHEKDNTLLELVVKELKNMQYLKDDFALGNTKYNGVSKLPRYKTYRRIDIMYTDPERFPFALLYFTGSMKFNVDMRNIAIKMGLSLNEYGFSKLGKKQEKMTIKSIKTEADIFKYLGMEYVPPEKR